LFLEEVGQPIPLGTPKNSMVLCNWNLNLNKPVGDRDHEVLVMGSFGGIYMYTTMWELSRPTTSYKGYKHRPSLFWNLKKIN
jgi:hypothetical protein